MKTTRTLIILNLAVIGLLLYLVSVYRGSSVFLASRLNDPLAEVHSLSFCYWAALVLVVLAAVACIFWQARNKYLHAGLLMLLAVMLWLTPYLMTDFIRFSDSSWHVGTAMKIPEILAGDKVAMSWYGWAYPGSFIDHYTLITFMDIDPDTYIRFFPVFCLLATVLAGYVLFTRLFGRKIAMLAMLLAIPGLHYLQIHASPHAVAAVLMLSVFILLTRPGIITTILAGLLVAVIAISHPTSPLLLGLFLLTALLALLIYYRGFRRQQLAPAVILVLCVIGWFFAYSHANPPEPVVTATGVAQPTQTTQAVQAAAEIIKKITPAEMETGKTYLQGTPFMYQGIYNLNKAIYYLYGSLALVCCALIALPALIRRRNRHRWLSNLAGMKTAEWIFVLSLPLLLLLTFLLAEQAHDLIETGLTYIILAASGVIASWVWRLLRWRPALSLSLTALALFFTLTYPLVAYSIDAYSSVPGSEKHGLQFLAREVSLEGKTINNNFNSQLTMYAPASVTKINLVAQDFKSVPDIAVFRSTSYYYEAIRFDYSFENNGYMRALQKVLNQGYNKVYSSQTFMIFMPN